MRRFKLAIEKKPNGKQGRVLLTLYRMDLDVLVQKNWNAECDLYVNKATQKYLFLFFGVSI